MRNTKLTAKLLLSVGFAALCAPLAYANPEGGTVQAGSATITDAGSTLTVNQASDRAVIDWRSFNIDIGETTRFNQPSASAVTLNRVTGDTDPSQILGNLSANGQIVLVNPNGIVFGEGATVDASALIATTSNITNNDFMAGRMNFNGVGTPGASVVNNGNISIADHGLAALVAPNVTNDGVINARLGKVALAGGERFELDLYGDGLVNFVLDGPADAGEDVIVSNSGRISASGGVVALTAGGARDAVNGVVNMDGIIEANTVEERGGRIMLSGSRVNLNGEAGANADGWAASGGLINISAENATLDGVVSASSQRGDGGQILLSGDNSLALGGTITASGLLHGGIIDIDAGSLSLAENISATGSLGDGGAIYINAESTLETSTSAIDVSGGRTGGDIRHDAGDKLLSSGSYISNGGSGAGGNIDVTAASMSLLSSQYTARGTDGGRVRLGGEYQGGKDLDTDELANASTNFTTDATIIDVSANGEDGNGGEAIIWSDESTVFLGQIDVRPGTQSGAGGFAEISSGDHLTYNGDVVTGRDNRLGTVLLDPKNITIVDESFDQFSATIIGSGFIDGNDVEVSLDDGDRFGASVSLSGNRLAVGSPSDDGATDNGLDDTGAVYLFSFADEFFNGAILEAVIGRDYVGGNNVDLQLDDRDFFGSAVSLDGLNLAVSATGDDGFINFSDDRINTGAIYLFSFDDLNFNGGQRRSIIGDGYTNTGDIDVGSHTDNVGASISLDGRYLAAGSPGDDGANEERSNYGAVYIFSFTGEDLTGGRIESTIGYGYSNENDFDLRNLRTSAIGTSVSLNNGRLAVGAPRGLSFSNSSITDTGAVYLFSFDVDNFDEVTLEAILADGATDDKNIDVDLEFGDAFGSSVSLYNNYLAVGANRDDGFNNSTFWSGAVYLFGFQDAKFSQGELRSIIGQGYAGETNQNLNIERNLNFGDSVSLKANQLVIGTMMGINNLGPGAVYLFPYTDENLSDIVSTGGSFSDPFSAQFGNSSDSNSIISSQTLAELLGSPQDVILQANNDIALQTDLSVDNPNGDGGDLTLEAGRSIVLNGSITTDNGNLNLFANTTADPEHVGSERDAGLASITLATEETINTGTGNVDSKILIGEGFATQGTINMNAADVTAANDIRYVEGQRVPTVDNDRVPGASTLDEGEAYSLTTEAFLFNDDLDRDTLTLTASGLPAGLAATDNGDGTLTITGTPSEPGVFTILITAEDDRGQTVTTSYALTVNSVVTPPPPPPPPVNEAPTVDRDLAIGTIFNEGEAIDFTSQLELFNDDGGRDNLVLTISGLPAGIEFTDNGNGTFSLTDDSAARGAYSPTVTATDAEGESVSVSLVLRIIEVVAPPPPPPPPPVNMAPTVSNNLITDLEVDLGNAISFMTPASLFNDDAGRNALDLSVAGLPAGVSFTDNDNGTATLSGSPLSVGDFDVTITARDVSGETARAIYSFSVNAPVTVRPRPVTPDTDVVGSGRLEDQFVRDVSSLEDRRYDNNIISPTGIITADAAFEVIDLSDSALRLLTGNDLGDLVNGLITRSASDQRAFDELLSVIFDQNTRFSRDALNRLTSVFEAQFDVDIDDDLGSAIEILEAALNTSSSSQLIGRVNGLQFRILSMAISDVADQQGARLPAIYERGIDAYFNGITLSGSLVEVADSVLRTSIGGGNNYAQSVRSARGEIDAAIGAATAGLSPRFIENIMKAHTEARDEVVFQDIFVSRLLEDGKLDDLRKFSEQEVYTMSPGPFFGLPLSMPKVPFKERNPAIYDALN